MGIKWGQEDCRFCYNPLWFEWFRPALYEFHINVQKHHNAWCPYCGKCNCGIRKDDPNPPKEYIEI